MVFGSLMSMFTGSDAGSSAAGLANSFSQQGVDLLKDQLEKSTRRLGHFFRAGKRALPGLEEGTTAEGLDARLARIFDTDTFGRLADERRRAVEGQLAAGGLTRSGAGLKEIARVPTDIGLALEQMLTGRLGGLAASGQNAALGLGQIGGSVGASIADILQNMGQTAASGALADEQSKAAGASNLLNAATTIGSMFFSDPALKMNVEPIGDVYDLTLYRWEWKPACKGTAIEQCGNKGFMADEVAAKYPHRVHDVCGLMVIDYPGLLDELEAKH